jgi:tRNA(Phe) wybutosine-synthesizing methylase Tyw3
MNQIILIGEATKLEFGEKEMSILVKTKDFAKQDTLIKVIVEAGYKESMVDVLKNKPLIAVKAGLRVSKNGVEFIAEKMSVLKLTEDDEKDSEKENGTKRNKNSTKSKKKQTVDKE